jgi:hypothetical protein
MTGEQPHPLDDPPPEAARQAPPAAPRPRRKNWRLRAMVAFTAAALGLYVFVRLDRTAAQRLGPIGEGVHDLFNQVPGKALPLTTAARRLVKDVEALGGDPGIHVTKAGFFGTLGQEEWCNVTFRNTGFDDAALARLADEHGGQIGGLYLENTGVTDAGLASLHKFTMLRHLQIRNYPRQIRPGMTIPPSKVTDAGLVHLKGLDHLWSLHLSDLPITDAGLEAIGDLPELNSLYLSRTKVRGLGLAGWKSLPRLSILYLDHGAMTEEGLKALSGATSLRILSLNGVHLTPDALPLLGAIPGVERLELTGCGFLDEEVDALVKSKPGLKVIRE